MDIANKVKVKECKSTCGMATWIVFYGATKLVSFTSEIEANEYARQIKQSLKGENQCGM